MTQRRKQADCSHLLLPTAPRLAHRQVALAAQHPLQCTYTVTSTARNGRTEGKMPPHMPPQPPPAPPAPSPVGQLRSLSTHILITAFLYTNAEPPIINCYEIVKGAVHRSQRRLLYVCPQIHQNSLLWINLRREVDSQFVQNQASEYFVFHFVCSLYSKIVPSLCSYHFMVLQQHSPVLHRSGQFSISRPWRRAESV
jgi:hypothetical protein